ncbi:flagellar motor stator protein MotA [Verrucomicrobiota bacterium]|jgi:chemotaxis protein MotA|nr:flagellar motor stator protein MotA [Verrucomicrobiota bacterium]
MLLTIGFIIVVAATLGGFMIAGGNPLVLLHVSEFVTIGGIALGILIISSSGRTLKAVVQKTIGAIKGSSRKSDYLDLLKLLYEVFVVARRSGLVALEDQVLEPKNSPLFQKYPSFLNNRERIDFLCDNLKPLIDGRIKPEQIGGLLHQEIAAREEADEGPVHVLQLIGDSLPGVGIIAAVLGIINTMAAIADGPAAVGERVAAALTGTFLGILGAYGFVNPITSRIKQNNQIEIQYYNGIMKGLTGFTGGMAPLMAVEMARRCFDPSVQPGAEEMELAIKAIPAPK